MLMRGGGGLRLDGSIVGFLVGIVYMLCSRDCCKLPELAHWIATLSLLLVMPYAWLMCFLLAVSVEKSN